MGDVLTDTFNWENGVSIIVPTFLRPEGIRNALTSLMVQNAGNRPLEIIVADNDPKGSAQDFVTTFAKTVPREIIYKHVPEPGVSNALNGGMAIARGRYIAILDDDMTASPGWIEALLKTAHNYDASVIFSPIESVMPNPNDALNKYMSPYFAREFKGGEGLTGGEAFGNGGCMLDLKRCDMPVPPFKPELNEVGGEDDVLFAYLKARGAVMAWSEDSLTYEHVPASRVTMKYFWKRNFAYGQSPSQEAADKGKRGVFGVLAWMTVGFFMTSIYAPICLLFGLFRTPSFVATYASLAQSIGKVFWWQSFSPRLYGATLFKKIAPV